MLYSANSFSVPRAIALAIAGCISFGAANAAHAESPADRFNRIMHSAPGQASYSRPMPHYGYAGLGGVWESKRHRRRTSTTIEYVTAHTSASKEVYFSEGTASIPGSEQSVLNQIGHAMQKAGNRHLQFMIVGHTDIVGGKRENQWLSERRALAVKRYLVENFGVHPARLVVAGSGKRQLMTPDRPDSWRNRRVEIMVLDRAALRDMPRDELVVYRAPRHGGSRHY